MSGCRSIVVSFYRMWREMDESCGLIKLKKGKTRCEHTGELSRSLRSHQLSFGCTLQAVREVQQQLFALSTQITQLRRDVDKLGTSQDTIKLRQKIADANQKSTAAAKSVGQKLNSLHAEQKTQQTGRLVSTFEVPLHAYMMQHLPKESGSDCACSVQCYTASAIILAPIM